MGTIEIQKIGITKTHAQCVVNAANNQLHYGSGVCGAIFRAAGYEKLTAACNAIGHCATGSAVITPAFDLEGADYIIHAVGPRWKGGDSHEPQQLYGCYRESLRLAKQHGCKSIAFPLISTGVFGYPKDKAWRKALQACNDFIRDNPDYDIRIIFAIRDEEVLAMGKAELDAQSVKPPETLDTVIPLAGDWPALRAAIDDWIKNGKESVEAIVDILIEGLANDQCLYAPILISDDTPDSMPINASSEDTAQQNSLYFKLQRLAAEDGKCWVAAFTSTEESEKGPRTSLFPQSLAEMLQLVYDEDDVLGLVIDPWEDSFCIPKEYTAMLLETLRPVDQDDLDLHAGNEAYQKGDYKTAMMLYQRAAHAGNVTAMSNLGYCYYYGRSVPVDKEQARLCWEKAAALGDICATYKLGDMFRNGDLPDDPIFARLLYRKAFVDAAEDKDPYDYPDACLRILKYCKEDCPPEVYRSIAEEAVIGFKSRIEDGDRYSENLLAEAQEILDSLDS